jgi:hypothetical protein
MSLLNQAANWLASHPKARTNISEWQPPLVALTHCHTGNSSRQMDWRCCTYRDLPGYTPSKVEGNACRQDNFDQNLHFISHSSVGTPQYVQLPTH